MLEGGHSSERLSPWERDYSFFVDPAGRFWALTSGWPTTCPLSGHPPQKHCVTRQGNKSERFRRNVLRKPSDQSSGRLSASLLRAGVPVHDYGQRRRACRRGGIRRYQKALPICSHVILWSRWCLELLQCGNQTAARVRQNRRAILVRLPLAPAPPSSFHSHRLEKRSNIHVKQRKLSLP
jgi:hypothetical protein